MRPELAQLLLARVTPANRESMGKGLVATLGRASVVPPIAADGKRQRPALPGVAMNALVGVESGMARVNGLVR